MLIFSRLAIPHGWGAHQWNVKIGVLFDLLYVRASPKPPTQSSLLNNIVHERPRDLVRAIGVLYQNGGYAAIFTHVCTQPNCQPICLLRVLDNYHTLHSLLHCDHISDRLCLHPARKDLEQTFTWREMCELPGDHCINCIFQYSV